MCSSATSGPKPTSNLNKAHRLRAVAVALVLIGVAVAAGGPIQVYFSKYFWCGRVGGGLALHALFILAASQIVLFLFSQNSDRMAVLYRWSQWGSLAACALQIMMLAQAYPTTFALLAFAFSVSFAVALAITVVGLSDRAAGLRSAGLSFGYLAVLAGLVIVHWLIVAGLVSQFFLYRPATPLTPLPLIFCLAAGLAFAIAGVWSFHHRNGITLSRMQIGAFPPLIVLLMALLRAKYGDGAFDTLLYKGTWPYQIAEWRTAGMAVLDSNGLTVNLQEMLNGLILILSSDYSPSLISTLSIGALFLILPACIQTTAKSSRAIRLVLGLATATIVSFTEAASAHGTAYQEPFLVLIMTMSLLSAWTWPLFLAAALVTKPTALAAMPLFFVYRFALAERFSISDAWRRRYSICGAAALIMFFVLPQIDRNLIYSGRILGLNEAASSWTDPPGPHAVLTPGQLAHTTTFPRGGVVNNFVMSSCNAFALDLLCDVGYAGNVTLGFHILPSSRTPLLGLVLALAVFVAAFFVPHRSALALVAAAAFIVGYFVFLAGASQGRYFIVPAFMFSVLLLCLAAAASSTSLASEPINGLRTSVLVVLLTAIPAGDLLTGTFINLGWECRRNFFTRTETYAINRPRNALEIYLSDIFSKYKEACRPPGLPPSVIIDPQLQPIPYLGAHSTVSPLGVELRQRFIAMDPNREKSVPLAVLAFVLHPNTPRQNFTGTQDDRFTECFATKDVTVLCSQDLAPFGKNCAQSAFAGLGAHGLGQVVTPFKFR